MGFPVGPVDSVHQISDGQGGLLGKIFEKIHLTMYCRSRLFFLGGRGVIVRLARRVRNARPIICYLFSLDCHRCISKMRWQWIRHFNFSVSPST